MSNFTDIIKYNSLPSKYEEQTKLAHSDLGKFINQIMHYEYNYSHNYNESKKQVIKVHTWQYESIKIYIKWLLDIDSGIKTFELHSTTIDNIEAPTPFSITGYLSLNYFEHSDKEVEETCLKIAKEMLPKLSYKDRLSRFEEDLKKLNQKNKEEFKRDNNPYNPYDNKRDYLESFLFEKYYDQFHESMKKWWKDYFLKFALHHGYDYPNIEKDCNDFDEIGILHFKDFTRTITGTHAKYYIENNSYRKYFIDLIKNKPDRLCLELIEEIDYEIECHQEMIQKKSNIYKLGPKKVAKRKTKEKVKQEAIYNNTDTKDIQKDLFA